MTSVCTTARRQVAAVILDAGGVILHPNLDGLAAPATTLGLPLTRDDLFRAYYRTIHELDLDPAMARRGPAFTDLQTRVWFFSRMLVHAGAPPERATAAGGAIGERAMVRFPRESDIYHWAMPGTAQRLRRLRDAGFRLGSASNNDDALEAQLESIGVRQLFSTLKDSGREGVAKPEPELLLRAARELSLPPAQCLYVGDVDRVDGQAARAAGMAFALLDPLDQPRPSRPLCIPSLETITTIFAPAS
jgi:HAD superfamily hydrolase (TIGR01509 family)